MAIRILLIPAVILFLFSSCTKEVSDGADDGFVKVLQADTPLAAVACFPSSDGQYIVVSRGNIFKTPGDIWGYADPAPGIITKLDQHGTEVWRKKVDDANRGLWNAIPLRAGGFITIGYSAPTSNFYNIIRYSDQGDVISIDSLFTPLPFSTAVNYTPPEVLELPNGNFVIAYTSSATGIIAVTDPNFNLLNLEKYDTPMAGTYLNTFYGLTQVNDSTLAVGGFSYYEMSVYHLVANAFLLMTNLNGEMRSVTLIGDTVYAESPNFVGMNKNGIVAVSSAMNGITTREGTWVDYFNNTNAARVSGRINLVHFDSTGVLRKRDKVYSYPGFGMISKAKPTRDGGFILCGTVNQSMYNTIDNRTMIYLLKLDENFSQQWSKVINTTSASFGVDVFETADGGYFVAGHQLSTDEKWSLVAAKTDANGNI